MSLIKKIKGLFHSSIDEKEIKKIERISIDELVKITENNIKESEELNYRLNEEIKLKIISLEKEIFVAIENLQNINLEKRKDFEKIKSVVNESTKVYINQLKGLIEKLNSVKVKNSKDYINKILSLIDETSKQSFRAFENSRILIGEELIKTREPINKFVDYIKKILKENEHQFSKEFNLLELKSKLGEFDNIKDYKEELNQQIEEFTKKINKNNNDIKKIKESIMTLKLGEDYKADIEKKNSREKELIDFEKQALNIKQSVDFKSLLKNYHDDKKKSDLIKNYSSNFIIALSDDKDLEIIKLLDKEEIKQNLKSLQEKVIELDSSLILNTIKGISLKEQELKKIESENQKIEESIIQEKKKNEKIDVKKIELFSKIEAISKKLFNNIEITI